MARSKDVSRVVTLLLLAAVSFAFIQAASARLQTIKSEEKFKLVDVVASNLLEVQILVVVRGKFQPSIQWIVDDGNTITTTIDPAFAAPGSQRSIWQVQISASRGTKRLAFALTNLATGNNLLYDVDQERFYGEKIRTPDFANWQLLQSEEHPERFKLRVLPEQVYAKWTEGVEPEIFFVTPRSSTFKSYQLA